MSKAKYEELNRVKKCYEKDQRINKIILGIVAAGTIVILTSIVFITWNMPSV